jgi:hypothetical protein
VFASSQHGFVGVERLGARRGLPAAATRVRARGVRH